MIRLAGLEEDKDISIVFTGLRPGEKLTEELFLSEEQYGRTLHDKIFVSRNGHVPHNQVWCDDLFSDVDELLAAAAHGDRTRLYAALHALVPEYAPTLSIWEGSKHG
jgi:FlaA1/EpsC-like NDP-sugar epimerase